MKLSLHNNLRLLLFVFLLLFSSGCSDNKSNHKSQAEALLMDQLAPDFTFHSMIQTKQFMQKLSAYQGKVIYLDFWASWCKPCTESMPLLDNLREELKSSGFEVIAVNLDLKTEKAIEFYTKNPVSYPVVRATNEYISQLYEINGMPTSYIIDREGIIRYKHEGFKPLDIIKIKTQILLYLNSENPS